MIKWIFIFLLIINSYESFAENIDLNHQNVVEFLYELQEQGIIETEEVWSLEDEIKKVDPKNWKKANKNLKKVSGVITSVGQSPNSGISLPFHLPNQRDRATASSVEVEHEIDESDLRVLKRVNNIIIPES